MIKAPELVEEMHIALQSFGMRSSQAEKPTLGYHITFEHNFNNN